MSGVSGTGKVAHGVVVVALKVEADGHELVGVGVAHAGVLLVFSWCSGSEGRGGVHGVG
ncbi:hypothetical protein ACQP04_29100 [Pseudonocardia halophobica]|uniref:hypothetical protein n=1 Tax=Pseudonocardia halophobica TaxID=29401 RepID=UPI003D8A37F7